MLEQDFSSFTIFGYGLGHVFNDICASMWFTYLLLFFQKVLGFSSTSSGVLLLVGQLADGAATTLVGLLSDKLNHISLFRRYGKRKSCHLLGSVCVLFSFPFIFLPCLWPNWSEQAQMIYYSCFIVIFQFGWAATQISHLALITDLSDSESVRTTLTSVRYGFTVASSILVYLTTWIFFGLGEESTAIGHEDVSKFRNIMIVGVSCGVSATIGFHFIVYENSSESKDIDKSIEEENQIMKKKRVKITQWLTNPELYLVAVIYMTTRLFVNLSQAYIPFYLQVSISMDDMSYFVYVLSRTAYTQVPPILPSFPSS